MILTTGRNGRRRNGELDNGMGSGKWTKRRVRGSGRMGKGIGVHSCQEAKRVQLHDFLYGLFTSRQNREPHQTPSYFVADIIEQL